MTVAVYVASGLVAWRIIATRKFEMHENKPVSNEQRWTEG